MSDLNKKKITMRESHICPYFCVLYSPTRCGITTLQKRLKNGPRSSLLRWNSILCTPKLLALSIFLGQLTLFPIW